ncbi:dephospho-CoA kinase [Metaclostridioides mangenotii]|uniref:dephospho-CoA kinase n=1 Tax=Metaclostridioides mangenotii TaxID=1540 RepID=UPI0004870B23|nr:dephospho-CoA kinase [Clostridioides mangenotii]
MLILGLTGNIGCGKSSLSKIFIKNGIDVIDADKVAREIMEDENFSKKIYEEFGYEIRNEDKTLNRKKLGSIVFKDEERLEKLNSLTHPMIQEEILSRIEYFKNLNKSITVIDAAILIEHGYTKIVDKLLVVTCNIDEQIRRVKKRDKCTKEEALNRINSQMNQNEKVKIADYIIDNSGTYAELNDKAYKFMVYMKENWCE